MAAVRDQPSLTGRIYAHPPPRGILQNILGDALNSGAAPEGIVLNIKGDALISGDAPRRAGGAGGGGGAGGRSGRSGRASGWTLEDGSI